LSASLRAKIAELHHVFARDGETHRFLVSRVAEQAMSANEPAGQPAPIDVVLDALARERVALRRAALLESIIENMGEAVLVVDRHGAEIFANKMHRDSRGPRGPIESAAQVRDTYAGMIRDKFGNELPFDGWPISRALRGEAVDGLEFRARGPSGPASDAVRLVTIRPLLDEHGVLDGAIIVMRDITEMRRAEEELRRSQRLEAIGQLTGGIAHDFNNVLAAILNAAEVVRRGVAQDARLDLAAQTIERAALRGAELTRHLLAFSRRQSLSPAVMSLDSLVEEALLLLRPGLGATIDVRVESPGQVFALADPALATTALLNLCINARDAMGEHGGVLTISIGVAPEFATLAVSDTGCGMAPETAQRAIEPFFTTKEIGKGTGLGLSMVYGFAKQSGGDLRIESELGKGTRVTLLLPRAEAPANDTISEPKTLDSQRGRVLVVDDDALVRQAICLQLGDAGFDTIIAANGMQALQLIEAGEPFDILFTDMVMPGGVSGLALAEALERLRPQVRAVVSTGYVDTELPDHGANWVLLRKPYTSEQLFAALSAARAAGR
jgi:signal transduction histidine kinase